MGNVSVYSSATVTIHKIVFKTHQLALNFCITIILAGGHVVISLSINILFIVIIWLFIVTVWTVSQKILIHLC